MLSDLKDPEAPKAAKETLVQPVLQDLQDCLEFPGYRANLDLPALCPTSSLTLTGSSCHRERTKAPTPSDTCRLRWDPWGPEVPQENLEPRVLRAGWDRRESTETEVLAVPRALTVREESEVELAVMASPVLTVVTEKRDQTDLPGHGACRGYKGCRAQGDTGAGTV